MKIDFHTHILPGIDDGADTIDTSLAMLDQLKNQHIDNVVLTPHYYSHHKPINVFTEERRKAYELLRASTQNTPSLHLGAEVYFSEYLFNNADLSPLCIEHTRTMLLELPYNRTIDDRMIDKIDRMVGEYGITPVIAHVERYPSLIHSRQLLERLLNFGCVLQVNLSSFTIFGKGRLVRLMQEGYFGALGTDAHNLTSRSPMYDSGYHYLEKKIGSDILCDVQSTMASLLNIDI